MTNPFEANGKPKLCYVVSSPMTAIAFLNGHIDNLANDFDITVVCNFDGSETQISKNAQVKDIGIVRHISPINDVLSVLRLLRFLRQERFDIVHSVTPKAGLIAAVSGFLAGTPNRLHWFTGQVWVLTTGPKRWLLKSLDKLIARLDTQLLVDSPSQHGFLVGQGILSESKSRVLESGSIAGVDTVRFRPDPVARNRVREELGIEDPKANIILFVGRINRDKGIDTLLKVFASGVLLGDPYLLFVGIDEEGYLMEACKLLGCQNDRLRHITFNPNPEKFMAAADIFCLPSLREGFGVSLIEAASCELPTVSTCIYGVTDAVEDKVTGFLIQPSNSCDLEIHLNALLKNPKLRKSLGRAGRQRVLNSFQAVRLQGALRRYYLETLSDDK